MRKLLFISGLVLCLPILAAAQDKPRVEIFTGYSYARLDGDANGHGWNLSVAGNTNDWFGLVGDVSGHYGDDVNGNLHSFLFGPKFAYRKDPRVTPYFQTLFGASHLSDRPGSDTSSAWTIGGGLDVKLHRYVALRAIQADYFLTRFNDNSQHNARLGFGLVWRID